MTDNARMSWERLLCGERVGEDRLDDPEDRTSFEHDIDRIVFSTTFKRLQRKTQVFPLPKDEAVHNRLNHSLETLCVGRSLGKSAGRFLARVGELPPDVSPKDVADLVGAACLAHDIGNPPLGHMGEEAISEFFTDHPVGRRFLDAMPTVECRRDFEHFEGNAQGFRVLLDRNRVSAMTYAVMGTVCKYPRPIAVDEALRRQRATEDGDSAGKKYGVFQSELATFRGVADRLGFLSARTGEGYCRHPLAYLVEAADDICYNVMDLEDAVRLWIVPQREGEGFLENIAWGDVDPVRLAQLRRPDSEHDPAASLVYLRGLAIGRHVREVSRTFERHYEDIMHGRMRGGLFGTTGDTGFDSHVRALSRRMVEVYCHPQVTETELAGFDILHGLLENFIGSLFFRKHLSVSAEGLGGRYRLAFSVLPENKRRRIEHAPDLYSAWRVVIDYVTGMTDGFALATYRKLRGMDIPS